MNSKNRPNDTADKQLKLPLTVFSHEEQGKASMRNLERRNNLMIEATIAPTVRRVTKVIRDYVRML